MQVLACIVFINGSDCMTSASKCLIFDEASRVSMGETPPFLVLLKHLLCLWQIINVSRFLLVVSARF